MTDLYWLQEQLQLAVSLLDGATKHAAQAAKRYALADTLIRNVADEVQALQRADDEGAPCPPPPEDVPEGWES